MKRLLLAIAMLALVAPAVEKGNAAEVSIDFFYDTLRGYGNWVELGNYGYAWQPTVAVGDSNWRPYADGYWAYTDVGWTWVSYEDFGWAAYHYGRWVRLRDRGWYWVPGHTWAPAWVSWRAGGDYIGWAPLPPDFRDEVVYEARPVDGSFDTQYDIGPLCYNFVDIRSIGEPVLRERIFEPAQNVSYMERTVNVTNITYNNNAVQSYGPDYNMVSAYSTRPVLRMALQHESVADPAAAAQTGALMLKQGDKLVVATPLKLEQAAVSSAPKVVKEKITQPTIERGWSGAGDPTKIAELKQKIKTENPKQIPPPDIKPRPGASVTETTAVTAASPARSPAIQSAARAAVPAKGSGKSIRTKPVGRAEASAVTEHTKGKGNKAPPLRMTSPTTVGAPHLEKAEKPKKGAAHDSAPAPGR